jgi:type I restriction enzyme S subunit
LRVEAVLLPPSWTRLPVKDVIRLIPLTRKKIKRSQYLEKGSLPVVDQGKKLIGGYTNNEALKITHSKPVIVFGDHTRKIKFIDFDFAAGADGIKVFEPLALFDPKLLFFFLQGVNVPNKGYSRHFQFLANSTIPVPPVNEQQRILNKLEFFFSCLDAGMTSINKVQSQLNYYRHALLKHAMEGTLTEEWRHSHAEARNQLNDSATEVLKRKLPTGWMWTKIGSIGQLISGQHILSKDYSFKSDGTQYLTGPSDFGKTNPIITKWTLHPKIFARKDDILITVKGSGVGKVNLLNLESVAIGRQIMAIRSQTIEPRFLFLYLQYANNELRKLSRGSTIPGIRREEILNFPIPVCSNDEQKTIIQKVEFHLSIIENQEKIASLILAEANNLRRSILSTALSGELTVNQ